MYIETGHSVSGKSCPSMVVDCHKYCFGLIPRFGEQWVPKMKEWTEMAQKSENSKLKGLTRKTSQSGARRIRRPPKQFTHRTKQEVLPDSG
jgi:hypothetical protein